MRLLITTLLLATVLLANAQNTAGEKQAGDQTQVKKVQTDSPATTTGAGVQNMEAMLDSLRMANNMAAEAKRNGEMMLQWHKERQEKQKKKMYLYMGMGVLFLAIMVVGLLRKRKK